MAPLSHNQLINSYINYLKANRQLLAISLANDDPIYWSVLHHQVSMSYQIYIVIKYFHIFHHKFKLSLQMLC